MNIMLMHLKEALKRVIEKEVFVTNILPQIGDFSDQEAWIFDFRSVLMEGEVSDLVSSIFYEQFKEQYPFQLGTLEVGGVPLVVAILNKLYALGHRDVTSFFVRKSRKKSDLLKMIEGNVQEGVPIILVDDIMNSGNSFWRQVEVLEDMGCVVHTVWSIVRYRDKEYYKRFLDRGIQVESLFTLDDFTTTLGPRVKNFQGGENQVQRLPLKVEWTFRPENPSLNHVCTKSQPIIDEDTIYFGTDNERFFALDQATGAVKWSFKVGPHTKGKSIFSSPVFYGDFVIFGSYDGNVYALNKENGKRVWVSFEADWIGSSPTAAPELGLVFIGLEFGLFRRHGGISALDAKTGKLVWINQTHNAFTHASPAYIPLHEQVVIGSNEGIVRLYAARTGEILWKFKTFGGADYDERVDSGFGLGEIKQSIAYDEERDYLVFGATDGFLYILNRSTGHLIHHYKCEFAIWATPYLFEGKVYFTSLDKRIRCIDLDTFECLFIKEVDGTRLFGSPTVIDGKLFVGTNAARLHTLDPLTGEKFGYFQTRERITNTVLKNQTTGKFFLPTYANEIICLRGTDT